MRIRLRHLWEVLSSSFWFVPTVMVVAAIGLAFTLLYLDHSVITSQRQPWIYSGSADGAKTMLSTVAGSIITVAGVVFSITIAALAQASSQFGPRLLRTFIRDRGNQLVLGTFVATYMYCLLVLRAVRAETGNGGSQFVPHLSVTAAVLLAIASIAVLIFFIHHISIGLQAPAVVAAVRKDLEEAIGRLVIDQNGSGVRTDRGEPEVPQHGDDAYEIVSTAEGYVQAVDYESLLELASDHNLMIWLEHRAGDFIMQGSTLARAWPAGDRRNELSSKVNSAFFLGSQRTPEQDIEHSFRQLVEVAVRALSPGINDPFTAINCIDSLGAGVRRIADAGLPGALRYDRQGTLRVISPVTTFAGVLDVAFNQIRQYGRDSVAVSTRLLEVLRSCGKQLKSPEHRRALLRHAEMVYRQSLDATPEQRDRQDITDRWNAAVAVLSRGNDPREAKIPPDHDPVDLERDREAADRQR